MARTKTDPAVVRPSCPRHPGSRVRLDGFERCRWSDAHRRPRYRCVTVPGTRGHSFSVPIAVRQPTERHPDSGVACPTCEHGYGRHEGVKTGRDFVFGHQEIARLLLRIGEGVSLRAASRELRESVFRVCHRHRPARPFPSTRPGDTSRQANLAVNYLDAFAPAVIAALHPTSWPRVLVLDTTTLFTRGYRRSRGRPAEAEPAEVRVGNLKAGTILVALDGTARGAWPCLMRVAGAKDAESWRAFFATLERAPAFVVADLDPAIARAVRETWPAAILVPSRHHLAAQLHERALADGVPERIRSENPAPTRRPLPWTGERAKRWVAHPLHEAMLPALRGPAEWAAFCALVERHVPPDRLALRSWIATNEPLVRRGWLIAARHPDVPRATGALEGAIGEWLAPLRRRAGRWQNARRLDLVLALITLRARGEGREARYAKLVRATFLARGNRSHLAAENALPIEVYRGSERQMSWWRTWHDRDEASLPRLVREVDRRWRRRAAESIDGPAEAAVPARDGLGSRAPSWRRSGSAPRVGLGRQRRPRSRGARRREPRAGRLALPAPPRPRLGDAGRRPDLPRFGLPIPHGRARPPRRVARCLLPLARARVAPDPQRAAARAGHPGLGARDRLALRAGARVVGPGLPAHPLGQRLSRLLPAHRCSALEVGSRASSRRAQRRRAGPGHRPPGLSHRLGGRPGRLSSAPGSVLARMPVCHQSGTPFPGR